MIYYYNRYPFFAGDKIKILNIKDEVKIITDRGNGFVDVRGSNGRIEMVNKNDLIFDN